MSESMGLRARKKVRVRDELERAALRLFAERGYAATTVEQITAAADFSERTFFRYFRNKEDVVFADHAASLARLRELLDQRSATESVLDAVRRAILELQDVGQDRDRELALARIRLVQETPALAERVYALQAEYEAVIATAIARSLPDDPDAWLKGVIIAGAAVAAMALRAEPQVAAVDADHDPTRLTNRALELLARASQPLLEPSASRP
jgi:AcrR family transcriptional regulator